MSLLSSRKKNAAWIRIDRNQIDAMFGSDNYRGVCSAGMIDAIEELADWLASRSLTHVYVTISSQCCFICEFDFMAGSAAASDTAIRSTAEACLPVAFEDVAAIYFRHQTRVLFVAVRKALLRQLRDLPAPIKVAVPESLLLTSGEGAMSKLETAVQTQTESVSELVTWLQMPAHWTVIEGGVGQSSTILDQTRQDLGTANVKFIDWQAGQGLALSQAAFAKVSRSVIRRLDFLADSTLDSNSSDATSTSILQASQVVFGCCLVLICALLYRRGNLDTVASDLTEQRTELVKTVFETNPDRVSDRKLLSELQLRRGRQETADAWLNSKPVSVAVFADVLKALDAQADVNVVSVESNLGSVEVACQVQTKARASLLVKQLGAAGFEAEVLYQRPADGLINVQLLLNPLEEGV